jgi:hypothetical protein
MFIFNEEIYPDNNVFFVDVMKLLFQIYDYLYPSIDAIPESDT